MRYVFNKILHKNYEVCNSSFQLKCQSNFKSWSGSRWSVTIHLENKFY